MGKKVRINVTVDEDLYHFAKDMGLNISRFLNNRLEELKNNLQSSSTGVSFQMKPLSFSKKGVQCRGRDSNPRTPTGRDPKSRTFDLAR